MNEYRKVIDIRRRNLGAYCLQDWDELAELAPHIAKLRPGMIAEIGCADAGWPYMFAGWFAPNATYIGIDTLQRFPDHRPRLEATLQKLRSVGMNAYFIRGRSDAPDVLAVLKEYLERRPLDLLHIDGCHTYEAAKLDWQTYGPLVRKGGLVVFHDVELVRGTTQNVRKLWEEIVAAHPGKTWKFYHKIGIGAVEV